MKKKENEVNNLEGRYKGKSKNYQHYQTCTSQITSINFSKPSIPNQPSNEIPCKITKIVIKGETTNNKKNS